MQGPPGIVYRIDLDKLEFDGQTVELESVAEQLPVGIQLPPYMLHTQDQVYLMDRDYILCQIHDNKEDKFTTQIAKIGLKYTIKFIEKVDLLASYSLLFPRLIFGKFFGNFLCFASIVTTKDPHGTIEGSASNAALLLSLTQVDPEEQNSRQICQRLFPIQWNCTSSTELFINNPDHFVTRPN